MKLTTLAAAVLPALVSAAGAPTFASGAVAPLGTLDTSHTQLIFANNTIFIGDVKYSFYSEPLLLTYPGSNGPGGSGPITFTSFHANPAEFRSLFVYPSEARAVGIAVLHSIGLPAGADSSGFTVGKDQKLRYGTTNGFHVCATPATPAGTYQLFYVGAGVAVPEGCVGVDINAYGEGACPW